MRSRLRIRRVAAVAVVVGAISAWISAPRLLRQVDWFEIRRVEVTGTRLLPPSEVLAAAGVEQGQSLWTDRSVWLNPLLAHDAVAGARISRRIPGTLRIQVQEERPAAYVEAGTLRLAAADGSLLSVDPRRAPVDLPIVRADWSDSAGIAIGRRLVREAARIASLDPALIAEVSEISPLSPGSGAIVLSHELGELVVPEGVDATRLAELRAVLHDVATARSAGDPSAARVRVDLRYRDQVVLRFPSSA
jgi:hypothetical protein